MAKKAKRRKKYQYDEGYPAVLENHSFQFEWCCDCGLRHINFYEVERSKKPEDDKIKVYCIRDNHGTDYRKDYERLKKESKVRNNAT